MSKEEWLENLGDIRILNSDIRIFVYVRVLNLITHFFSLTPPVHVYCSIK